VPCRSKSGGLHLYLFFLEALPAELVDAKLKQFVTWLGLSKETERFPKQTHLEPEDTGNC